MNNHWLQNILAGILLSVTSLFLITGFSMAAGLPPVLIFTSFLVINIVLAIGNKRNFLVGLTPPAIIVILIVSMQNPAGSPLDMFILFLIPSALFLLLSSFQKTNSIISLIPLDVITGIFKGIGVILILKQLGQFYNRDLSFEFQEPTFSSQIANVHWPLVAIALSIPLISFAIKRINSKLPDILIGVVASVCLYFILQPEDANFIHISLNFLDLSAHTPLPHTMEEGLNQVYSGATLTLLLFWTSSLPILLLKQNGQIPL